MNGLKKEGSVWNLKKSAWLLWMVFELPNDKLSIFVEPFKNFYINLFQWAIFIVHPCRLDGTTNIVTLFDSMLQLKVLRFKTVSCRAIVKSLFRFTSGFGFAQCRTANLAIPAMTIALKKPPLTLSRNQGNAGHGHQRQNVPSGRHLPDLQRIHTLAIRGL
jgi:hypothetical protein